MICTICGREYLYSKTSGHTKTVCNSCMVNRHRQKRKRDAIAYKGGKCQECGYNKCERALEFHHVTGNKKFGISGSHARSWEAVKKELDKCILVCANCHAEIHEQE